MRVLTGTSGFSYVAWRGSFYPTDLPPRRMLAYYATHLRAVEVNSTFRRLPTPEALAAWKAQVPPGFVFALKAPQQITHVKRLRDAASAVTALYRAAAELSEQLGPVLYQLPPSLKKDLPRLRDFLETLPAGGRAAAFEFRDPSWHSDDVLSLLARSGAALCIADSDERSTPFVATTGFGYLRLRRSAYSQRELYACAEHILAQPWNDALAFFMHEDEARGPAYALHLESIVSEVAGARLGPAVP